MKHSWPLFLTVFALFLVEICNELTTTGMFLDGMVYANLAANLSQGIGSLWQPSLSPSYHPLFMGHPPLSFGLLSLCYRLFGVHIWVTKGYSLFMVLLTGALTARLWTRVGFKWQTAWLPLLLWMLVPLVSQFACDNMLEGPMGVFVLASVLCMTHHPANRLRRIGWHLLAGCCLSLAFLTKGFTGLYPLCFPLIVWLADRLFLPRQERYRLSHALGHCLTVAFSLCLSLLLLGLAQPAAADYLKAYLSEQIVGGIQEQTVSSRWFIVVKFFESGAIVWLLAVAVLVIEALRQHRSPLRLVPTPHRRTAFIFLLLALSGVLPMMVSTKQSNFYIITVFPFFAVAMGALLYDIVRQWLGNAGRRFGTAAAVLAVALSLAAIALNAANCGKPGRDNTMQEDIGLICAQLEQAERVGIPPSLCEQYSLFNYAYRAKQIDMHTYDFDHPCEPLPRHLITFGDVPIPSPYREVPLGTHQLKLFER